MYIASSKRRCCYILTFEEAYAKVSSYHDLMSQIDSITDCLLEDARYWMRSIVNPSEAEEWGYRGCPNSEEELVMTISATRKAVVALTFKLASYLV